MTFSRKIGCRRVLPNLVGIRRKIDLGRVLAVEGVHLFVVDVEDGRCVFVLEERFVSTDDFRVLFQAAADTCSKSDDALDALRGKE